MLRLFTMLVYSWMNQLISGDIHIIINEIEECNDVILRRTI